MVVLIFQLSPLSASGFFIIRLFTICVTYTNDFLNLLNGNYIKSILVLMVNVLVKTEVRFGGVE